MRRGTRLSQWLLGFVRQTQGNVAMMFGLALPLLVMVSLGAIDIHQASRVKANLQDALDAAALAAARSTYSDATKIQEVGMNALKANMPDYFAAGSIDSANFVLNENVLRADAKVNVRVLVANIILPPYGKLLDDYLLVSSHSEVLRASRNVEVGIALDVTESMKGTHLTALKEAAAELVDIVVQDQQTPFYSKVGLAPYSQGVNVGAYAAAARGGVAAPKPISKMEWAASSIVNITSISKTSSAVLSANNHNFENGDVIYLADIANSSNLSAGIYVVTSATTNSFRIYRPGSNTSVPASGSWNTTITARAVKCLRSDCAVRVTSAGHGLKNGDPVQLEAIEGMTQMNGTSHAVREVTSSTFIVDQSARMMEPYSKGGEVWCASFGCRFYRFTNANGGISTHEISTCTSERTGTNVSTDMPPSTTLVGRNYPGSLDDCPASVVTPLTSSRSDLKAAINGMSVTGSTAGQIGIAWAWYLVSDRFANFWGGTSAPAEHDPAKTLKVVVLMTDGEFNTTYCNGVVASNAAITTGFIPRTARSNCNSTNGEGFAQSLALCTAMKNRGVVVYTVAFNLSTGSGGASARNLMETCATDKTTHFHNTTSSTQLKDAFRAIGRDITRLRLAR